MKGWQVGWLACWQAGCWRGDKPAFVQQGHGQLRPNYDQQFSCAYGYMFPHTATSTQPDPRLKPNCQTIHPIVHYYYSAPQVPGYHGWHDRVAGLTRSKLLQTLPLNVHFRWAASFSQPCIVILALAQWYHYDVQVNPRQPQPAPIMSNIPRKTYPVFQKQHAPSCLIEATVDTEMSRVIFARK